MPLSPGSRLGPYEIIAPIGAGGMGEVYRAHDSRTGRDVAIKVSAEQFSERFSREVHAVAALNHPNIWTLYDVGPNYLVLELVEGSTLEELLSGDPRFSPERESLRSSARTSEVLPARGGGAPRGLGIDDALRIARQIADALDAAHDKDIVHRDLKPANIKVTPDGVVKVLDFGLATAGPGQAGGAGRAGGEAGPVLTNSPTFAPLVTGTGVILGTAAYMAPEQARGQAVDKRADIWAFGVILFEMLSGRRLFEGDTASDTLASVLKEEPDWQPRAGQYARVAAALSREGPENAGCAISATRCRCSRWKAVSLPDRPRATGRSTWIAWSAAAVFLAAASAIAIVHFREKAPTTPEAIRFEIPLPPSINEPLGLPFSISPDGHRLASLGFGPDGRFHFHIRALDSLEYHDVPDTDVTLANWFFWSPDSRFIAFEEDGKLKRVDVAGGTAKIVCDLPGRMLGGSWNRDDMIIFGFDGGGIMRVPAGGGSPSPVTTVDPAHKEMSHLEPAFLPDGRHFVYGRGTSRFGSDVPVFLGSIDVRPDQQETRELLATHVTTAGLGLAFASSPGAGPGQLLYLRGRALVAQPFDVAGRRLFGEGVPLVETSDAGFSVSSTGVLVTRAAGAQSYQLTWIDRHGRTLSTIGEPGPYTSGALSPDGARAAVLKIGSTGGEDLWLLDLARGTSTPLTFGETVISVGTAWSPDSRRIALGLNQGTNFGLLQAPIDGAPVEVLMRTSSPTLPASWSRDGRFILFTSVEKTTKQDVGVLSLSDKPTQTCRCPPLYYFAVGRRNASRSRCALSDASLFLTASS